MKNLLISDLPNPLNEQVVAIMMQMEEWQSKEWQELSLKLPFDLEKQYFQLKAKLQNEKSKPLEFNWDKEQLAYWGMYVNRERHYTDYTIEDMIEMSLSKDFYTRDKLNEIFVEWKNRERILNRQLTVNNNELFTFFWITKSPFSQWHKSNFKAKTFIYGDSETKKRALETLFPVDIQEYSSAEQFMMYHKAMIFLDREIAQQIMQTDDVRQIKDLGRQVKNYDEYVWKYFRSKVVYEGNKAKFTQNEELKKALFATKGTTLVEAAPNDTVWGIGLAEDDPRASKRETWLGKNLLGEILTQIRIELMGEY